MSKAQMMIAVRFKEMADLENIKFSEVESTMEAGGHQFFDVDGVNNVIVTPPHNVASGISYVVTSEGIYESIMGQAINRASIFELDSLVKNVKSESKKMFKDKSFSVRKSRTKGKVIEDNGWKVACFTILEKDLDSIRQSDLFTTIASFLNEEVSEFLGEINGIPVDPVRFGTSSRGVEDVILDGNSVGLVRLNGGQHYTCNEVGKLKSQPVIIERNDGESVRKQDRMDDIGMKLFLEANGYAMTNAKK